MYNVRNITDGLPYILKIPKYLYIELNLATGQKDLTSILESIHAVVKSTCGDGIENWIICIKCFIWGFIHVGQNSFWKFNILADKPDSITLEWEHSINKPGSVQANQEYKLKCVTKNSHPPATHRYFKGGVELSQSKMEYTFNNYTDTGEL